MIFVSVQLHQFEKLSGFTQPFHETPWDYFGLEMRAF